jgi:glycopeptide antibiotics resistance protein
MRHSLPFRPVWPDPNLARRLCWAYAVFVTYSSTVVGPDGTNFVPHDPVAAFRALLAMRFVPHGSDQRADWIGNLLMLVPFGFLAAAAVQPAVRRGLSRIARPLAALGMSVALILAVKYLQLFFPPRTVTLNYVTAQAIGAALGCAMFAAWHDRIGGTVQGRDPVAGLRAALALYAAGLAVFVLMPLDFAISLPDIRAQVAKLPGTVWTLPGADRAVPDRAATLLAACLAFAPVGALFELTRPRRVLAHAVAVAAVAYALSTMVISAFPALASIFYRTAGAMLGAAALRWLMRQDTGQLRARLRALVPWLVPPYLATVLLVAGLVSAHWLAPGQAAAHAGRLGLIPLFNYYIVTKEKAAKSIAAHALMYAPVGVALWLIRPGRRTAAHAFAVAACLSFLVELGRYFIPGQEGDINAVAVGGAAAMLAAKAMPAIWSFLSALARAGG